MADNEILNIDFLKIITGVFSDSENLEIMAPRLNQVLVGALGIKGAAFFVLNPRNEELEVLSSFGLSDEYINKGPILVDKSIRLPSNRGPVVIEDTEESEQLQYPEKAKAEGIRAIVSLPINMRGKLIGALRLYHSKPWDIPQKDLDFLMTLTDILGMAMMYYRLNAAISTIRYTVKEIHTVWLEPF